MANFVQTALEGEDVELCIEAATSFSVAVTKASLRKKKMFQKDVFKVFQS